MAGYLQQFKKSVSSLYTDSNKWGIVKSLGVFCFGIYLARDLKGICIDGAAGSVPA